MIYIQLVPQTNAKNEAPNARNKSRQKSIERECSDQTAIDKLYNTSEKYVAKVGINYLQFGWSIGSIPEN